MLERKRRKECKKFSYEELTSYPRKTYSFPAKAIGKWIDILTYTKIQDGCEMSRYPIEQDTLNNENISDQERRTQTDSVHERFRSDFYYVYCDDCKDKIEPNKAAIEKHYENKSHPSNRTCRYCRGKVFMYQRIVNGADNGQSYIFHRCKHEYFPEESITDES